MQGLGEVGREERNEARSGGVRESGGAVVGRGRSREVVVRQTEGGRVAEVRAKTRIS